MRAWAIERGAEIQSVHTEQGYKLESERPGYEIVLVNPSDRTWTRHRYVLAFGAYGWTRLMVWANSLDDALDEAVDWIADHEPGLLADEQVEEAYREALADEQVEEAYREALAEHCDDCSDSSCSVGEPCDECAQAAQTDAEVDTTIAGNAGHYINSWEWSVAAEDPTRDQLKELLRW